MILILSLDLDLSLLSRISASGILTEMLLVFDISTSVIHVPVELILLNLLTVIMFVDHSGRSV